MIYVMPRTKKQRRPRFEYMTTARTVDQDEGARLLFASAIATAVEDYLAGPDNDAETARWYLAGEEGRYLRHAAAVGLPVVGDWPVPEDMRPYVVRLEEA